MSDNEYYGPNFGDLIEAMFTFRPLDWVYCKNDVIRSNEKFRQKQRREAEELAEKNRPKCPGKWRYVGNLQWERD